MSPKAPPTLHGDAEDKIRAPFLGCSISSFVRTFSQVSFLCFSIKPCKNAVAKIELRSTHANAITRFAGGSNSESRWESELQRVHHLQPRVAVTRTLLAASSCQPQREEGDSDTHHQQEVAHLNISVFGDADHFRFYYISDLSKVQPPPYSPSKVCVAKRYSTHVRAGNLREKWF